jgi:hypothetical protein
MCLSTWQVEASGYDELEGAARHKTYGRDAAMRPNACGLPPYDGDDAQYFRHTRGTKT